VLGRRQSEQTVTHVADSRGSDCVRFQQADDPLNGSRSRGRKRDLRCEPASAEACGPIRLNSNANILYGGVAARWPAVTFRHRRLDATGGPPRFALSRGSDDAVQLGVSELSQGDFG